MCDSSALELILRALFAYVHMHARDLFRELNPDDYAAIDMAPLRAFDQAFENRVYRLQLNPYRPIYLDSRLNEIVARVIHYNAYAAEQGEPDCPQHLLCDVIGGGHGPKLHLDALKHFYRNDADAPVKADDTMDPSQSGSYKWDPSKGDPSKLDPEIVKEIMFSFL